MGGLFMLMLYRFGWTWDLLIYVMFAAFLLSLSVIDIAVYRLPNPIVLTGAIFAVLFTLIFRRHFVMDMIFGGVVGFGLLIFQGIIGWMIVMLRQPKTGSALFFIDDFRAPAGFIAKIKNADTPISKYIRNQLSPKTKQLLDKYDYSTSPEIALKRDLVIKLDQILRSNNFYSQKRFQEVEFSKEVTQFIDKKPKGKELHRLNRLLLEAAYPREIEKSPEVEAVGYGDIKLAGMIGLFLGPWRTIGMFIIAAFIGTFIGGFITIIRNNSNRFQSIFGSAAFNIGDIMEPDTLAIKIADAGDPLSFYIRKQLPTDRKQLIHEYDDSKPPSDVLKKALVSTFNRLIQNKKLFNEERFKEVELNPVILNILQKKPNSDAIYQLNKSLLMQAYPREFTKNRIPFGPYIACGAIIVLIWGDQLWHLYLTFIGP